MIVGETFGRLTALRPLANRRWLFSCSCGNTHEADRHDVSKGGTKSIKSCGCLRRDLARTKRVIHDSYKTAEYHAWQKAKRRCVSDPFYLKRSIKMASEWIDNPMEFIRHIGQRPSSAHTVERIDNDRGYEPGNVRWATHAEQSRNTVRNVWIDYHGQRLVLADVARLTGIGAPTLKRRVSRGLMPGLAVLPCP